MKLYQKYPVHDELKIPSTFLEKWQFFLNSLADFLNVPSALIMRVHADEIEVFSMNTNRQETPYKVGATEKLDSGLYCEYVMTNQKKLLVPNAKLDPLWDHNPDIPLGMISYLGFPLTWPSNRLFGTICVLDNKENQYSRRFETLLEIFAKHIESDLGNIYQLDHLNKTNDNLKEFACRLSHDIKGPLGIINSFANLVEHGHNEHCEVDLVHRISSISNNLILLTESLLAFSKTNQLSSIMHTDLNLLINEVLQDFNINDQQLLIEHLPPLDADPILLKQVFYNVFKNALQYKHPGRPLQLTIKVQNTKHPHNFLLVISDNGIGMRKEDVEKSFTPFFRGGNQDTEGHGIGLATCKKIIDLHQGRIWAESEQGKGTSIYIELPGSLRNIETLVA